MNLEEMNLASVSAFSQYAVSAAREYVRLTEEQLAKAQAELHASAVLKYREIEQKDETDYDTHVAIVDTKFEEDYLPILRFTQVIYVYMIFESFVLQHIYEIEPELKKLGRQGGDLNELEKQKKQSGLAKAVRLYFRKIKWSVIEEEEWDGLEAISAVRNCVVHNSGVVRGCDQKKAKKIHALVDRGIGVHRYKDKDTGEPMTIHPKFLGFFLDIVEKLFNAIVEKSHAEFWSVQANPITGPTAKR